MSKKQKYLLDTNICIFLLKKQYGIAQQIEKVGVENCFISDITLAELYYGAANSGQKEKKMIGVKAIEELFPALSIHEPLETFADIKTILNSKGLLIDDFDLLIGATALTHDLIMVTDNLKHFSRIPGIKIENWVKR